MRFRDRYRIETSRLVDWDYAANGWYFVTICTRGRECFFGGVVDRKVRLSPIGMIVADEWTATPRIRANVALDEWIVMPNHIHAIVVITSRPETSHRDVSTGTAGPSTVETSRWDVSPRRISRAPIARSRLQAHSLGAIIGQFKSVCTKRIWAAGCSNFAWQPRFYDHIVRSEQSLQLIREYIRDNPAKWELDRDNAENIFM